MIRRRWLACATIALLGIGGGAWLLREWDCLRYGWRAGGALERLAGPVYTGMEQFQAGAYTELPSPEGVGKYGHLALLCGQYGTDKVPAGPGQLALLPTAFARANDREGRELPAYASGDLDLGAWEPCTSAPIDGYRYSSFSALDWRRRIAEYRAGISPAWDTCWQEGRWAEQVGLVIATPERVPEDGRWAFVICMRDPLAFVLPLDRHLTPAEVFTAIGGKPAAKIAASSGHWPLPPGAIALQSTSRRRFDGFFSWAGTRIRALLSR